jgi:hypothetical protein
LVGSRTWLSDPEDRAQGADSYFSMEWDDHDSNASRRLASHLPSAFVRDRSCNPHAPMVGLLSNPEWLLDLAKRLGADVSASV